MAFNSVCNSVFISKKKVVKQYLLDVDGIKKVKTSFTCDISKEGKNVEVISSDE